MIKKQIQKLLQGILKDFQLYNIINKLKISLFIRLICILHDYFPLLPLSLLEYVLHCYIAY